jgi:hypothetical protein
LTLIGLDCSPGVGVLLAVLVVLLLLLVLRALGLWGGGEMVWPLG